MWSRRWAVALLAVLAVLSTSARAEVSGDQVAPAESVPKPTVEVHTVHPEAAAEFAEKATGTKGGAGDEIKGVASVTKGVASGDGGDAHLSDADLEARLLAAVAQQQQEQQQRGGTPQARLRTPQHFIVVHQEQRHVPTHDEAEQARVAGFLLWFMVGSQYAL